MVLYSIPTIILFCLPLVVLGKGNEWAVLVAATSAEENLGYSIQSSVCHTYQLLHAHGIPDERIIVMMVDDAAYVKRNPHQGKIFNNPNGPNVYENVPKDYIGEDVTVENFLHILSGNESAVSRVGSGKVLKSGPEDDVFIFLMDHGNAGGIFYFPHAILHASNLSDALHGMYDNKQYNKLVFYLESCYSGGMFPDLPPNVWAITSSTDQQESAACYCNTTIFPATYPYQNCLGGCFSVSFLENSDKLGNLHRESLMDQFEFVRKDACKRSKECKQHPMLLGDRSLGRLPLADFQGEKTVPAIKYPPVVHQNSVSFKDAQLLGLMKAYSVEKNSHKTNELAHEIMQFHQKESQAEALLKSLVSIVMANDFNKSKKILSDDLGQINHLKCHGQAVHAFHNICLQPLQLVRSSRKEGIVLANMCEAGIDVETIEAGMHIVCPA